MIRILELAVRLPDWVWGRNVAIELALAYTIINGMAKSNRRKF